MNIVTIADLIEVLTLQKSNLPTFAGDVGATPQQILDVSAELDQILDTVAFSDIVDENKKGCTESKQLQFDGDPDAVVPDYPVFPVAPVVPRKAGLRKRANKRRDLWRAAPGYTNEIGVFLGISVTEKPSAPVGGYKPTVDLSAAQNGDLFSVVVGNRGEADMWDVLAKEVSTPGTAPVVKSGNGKATNVVYPPSTPPRSRQLQVQIQLKKNDQPYGQLSDIVLVTINP